MAGSNEERPESSGGPQGLSQDPFDRLMRRLGHRFQTPALLREALTHRSYGNEFDGAAQDNERLEFLGDAVLDLLVSEALMARHPEADEGALSRMRASVVSEKSLARVARGLDLGSALRMGRGEQRTGGQDKDSILADAFEAVIAALYRELGLEGLRPLLFERLAFPLDEATRADDPKSALQQRIQGEGRGTPSYRLVRAEGPDHAKDFEVELLVAGEVVAKGRGRSKKQAERAAAARYLAEWAPSAKE